MTGRNSGPLVSVIIPTYSESRQEVKRALQSVDNQSYQNVEAIVIDSANRDFLQNQCSDRNYCKYITQEPKGVSAARNLGLDRANGEVIAFLDADDYFEPEKLDQQVRSIQEGADIVYSDAYSISATGTDETYRESFPCDVDEDLYIEFFKYDGRKGNIATSTIALKSSCLGEDRFCEELSGGEDFHLWVRIFKKSDTVVYLPEPLAYIRQHDESLSSDPDMMYENRLKAIELLCDRFPELRQHRQERELLERYDYARHLMFDGQVSDARSIFFDLFAEEKYYRAAIMLLVSLLPAGHELVVGILDRVYSWVQ